MSITVHWHFFSLHCDCPCSSFPEAKDWLIRYKDTAHFNSHHGCFHRSDITSRCCNIPLMANYMGLFIPLWSHLLWSSHGHHPQWCPTPPAIHFCTRRSNGRLQIRRAFIKIVLIIPLLQFESKLLFCAIVNKLPEIFKKHITGIPIKRRSYASVVNII